MAIGIITARGGSKGIPNKNLVCLNKRPLIYYTIQAALNSCLSEIWITSDSKEILDYAESFGVKCILRPNYLAEDNSTSLDVLKHVVSILGENETYCLLQPTSPLRTKEHINEAMKIYNKDTSNIKSLVSIQQIDHKFIPESALIIDEKGYLKSFSNEIKSLRRQDKKVYYARNGAAIYIFEGSNIQTKLLDGNILCYEMNKIDSIDIDDKADLFIAESILQKRNE
jgi:CMP-N,N'-diacetyllegionaminic acid synthase